MAPKKTTKALKDANLPDQVSTHDKANFVTQLKTQGLKDETKASLLSHYSALPRFSQIKNEIVQKWKLDKTCRWATEYLQTTEKATFQKTSEEEGYGTRHLIETCILMFLGWAFGPTVKHDNCMNKGVSWKLSQASVYGGCLRPPCVVCCVCFYLSGSRLLLSSA
jgi:hypothetical protein